MARSVRALGLRWTAGLPAPRHLSAMVLLASASAAPSSPVVTTSSGKLRGSCDGRGVCSFLGVPFAAPPVGDLRWRPPQPVQPWAGVRDASSSGEDCLQFSDEGGKLIGNESCLFLNVWAPPAARCPNASCAVMFWIHGGSYETGGTLNEYNGSRLVAFSEDVVVVTVNYRLSIMGFLASNELRPRDAAGGSTGNYGIQDQRAGLEWVQRNIARFGGDRRNVMIFGQSAGAGSICVHLTSKRSWPLYHKAALESGAFSYWVAQPMQQAEQQYEDLLKITGCEGPRCLLALDASVLYDLATLLREPQGIYGLEWSPTVDGVELDQLPWDLLAQGRVNTRVPLLLGYNQDDGTIGLEVQGPAFQKGLEMARDDFEAVVTAHLGAERVPEALSIYGVDQPGGGPGYANWYWAATHMLGDYGFSCPTRRTARAFNAFSEQKVFHFYFAHTPAGPPWWFAGLPGQYGTSGASHSAELPFVFVDLASDNLGDPHYVRQRELRLSHAMAAYWISFARSSDPNAQGPPAANLTIPWGPFAAGDEVSIELNLPSLSTARGRLNRQCDFIDTLGPRKTSFSRWARHRASSWPSAASRASGSGDLLLV